MELATAKDQAEQHLQRLAEHATSSRRARALQHEAQRLEHKYGRRLERLAKQLPVDTPLDRRRRHRARRRGLEVGVLVVVAAGAAAAFLLFRHRDPEVDGWDAEERASDRTPEPKSDDEAAPTKASAASMAPATSKPAPASASDDAPRANGTGTKADAAS